MMTEDGRDTCQGRITTSSPGSERLCGTKAGGRVPEPGKCG